MIDNQWLRPEITYKRYYVKSAGVGGFRISALHILKNNMCNPLILYKQFF